MLNHLSIHNHDKTFFKITQNEKCSIKFGIYFDGNEFISVCYCIPKSNANILIGKIIETFFFRCLFGVWFVCSLLNRIGVCGMVKVNFRVKILPNQRICIPKFRIVLLLIIAHLQYFAYLNTTMNNSKR